VLNIFSISNFPLFFREALEELEFHSIVIKADASFFFSLVLLFATTSRSGTGKTRNSFHSSKTTIKARKSFHCCTHTKKYIKQTNKQTNTSPLSSSCSFFLMSSWTKFGSQFRPATKVLESVVEASRPTLDKELETISKFDIEYGSYFSFLSILSHSHILLLSSLSVHTLSTLPLLAPSPPFDYLFFLSILLNLTLALSLSLLTLPSLYLVGPMKFSNHLSHALVALWGLGGTSEVLNSFATHYIAHTHPGANASLNPISPTLPLHSPDWTSIFLRYRGNLTYYSSLLSFLRSSPSFFSLFPLTPSFLPLPFSLPSPSLSLPSFPFTSPQYLPFLSFPSSLEHHEIVWLVQELTSQSGMQLIVFWSSIHLI
jgi:hypothetical protein